MKTGHDQKGRKQMQPLPWHPPVELSEQEKQIVKWIRRAKLFVFLRHHRHELLNEGRGRKRSEEHLPNLLNDITALVDVQSQADPQFRTSHLYTRLTAMEVRRQLITQKGSRDDELPTAETIATKLNELGYTLKKVAKSQPQKNCPKPMPSLPK